MTLAAATLAGAGIHFALLAPRVRGARALEARADALARERASMSEGASELIEWAKQHPQANGTASRAGGAPDEPGSPSLASLS